MQDIVLDGFTGTTSGHYKNNVANINCSPSGTCGITVKRFSVTAPSGANTVLCANTPSNLGLTCTSGASG
ncbi:endo-xylogalacturonan hydrolase A like protein [Verticillium longisporum]|nr:endo-xylogalacturonan hydrolase A like protein [Verticillium longisporum]